MSSLLLEGELHGLMSASVGHDVRHVRRRAWIRPRVIGDCSAVRVESKPRVEVHIAPSPEENNDHKRSGAPYCVKGALYIEVSPQVQEEFLTVHDVEVSVDAIKTVVGGARTLAAIFDDVARVLTLFCKNVVNNVPLDTTEGTSYGVHKQAGNGQGEENSLWRKKQNKKQLTSDGTHFFVTS